MNNDLISREALKEAIETYDKFAYLPNGKLCPCRDLVELEMYLHYIHFDDVIKAIDNAPTVECFTKEDMSGAYNEGYACGSRESKRPQGEWLWLGDNPHPIHKWSCNKCGRGVKEQENFCPNCGADMRKGGVK